MLKLILAIYGLTQCYSIGVRKSSHRLSDDDKAEFLEALYLMKSTPSSYDPSYNAYDFFVYVHLLANDPFTTYGHGTWSFLPWHRIYLYLFEEEMQLVTNNTNLYLPYWDPTNTTESDILLNDYTFLGGNGVDVFPYLLPDTSTLSCDKWSILPSLNGRPDLYNYTCLHRQIGEGFRVTNWNNTNTTKYLYQELLPKSLWDDVIMTYRVYDVSPYNSASDNYTLEDHESSFRSMLEGCTKWNPDGTPNADLVFITKLGACQGLHGHLHGHIGGQLASLASPNDPLFFLLHNWVDLMWSRYQEKYGDELSAIPEDFLDIDVTQDKFPENDILTTRQVLDHEVQLGYVYDYDYDLDVEDDISSTSMIDESSVGMIKYMV
eukprot:CAMPEP_0201592982 /NCGR_PEP_ID=MMETSP0190_2-20130828/190714_1 /ASSEMBLY_ACC=CAM_ASM_000263 /TAXON_ID=37353 /ORGANISM="Rosalina sp." /LENGTH=376 /DNA_ID=CAMNT_0048051971 /DNA_START=92 /DNA_END=1223 /DNA_ORIENTATION=+